MIYKSKCIKEDIRKSASHIFRKDQTYFFKKNEDSIFYTPIQHSSIDGIFSKYYIAEHFQSMEALDKPDSFIQATFIELFGASICTDSKTLTIKDINNFCKSAILDNRI